MRLFWSVKDRRLRAMWRLLLWALLILLAWLALRIAVEIPLSLVLGPASQQGLFGLAVDRSVQAAAVLLALWIAVRLLNRESLAAFGYRPTAAWWVDFIVGAGLGLAVAALFFGLAAGLGWTSIVGFMHVVDVAGPPFAGAAALLLLYWLSGAVFEETVTRGYPLRNLAQGLAGAWLGERSALAAGLVITSLAFVAGHPAVPRSAPFFWVNAGLAGFLFGLSYIWTGQFGLAIGFHLVINWATANLFGFQLVGEPWSSAAAVIQTTPVHGPELWTGGAVGPTGGLLITPLLMLAMVVFAGYARLRVGRLGIATPPLRRGAAD